MKITAYALSACLLLLFSIGGDAAALSSPSRSEYTLYSLEDQLDSHPDATQQPLMVPITLISSSISSSKGAGNTYIYMFTCCVPIIHINGFLLDS